MFILIFEWYGALIFAVFYMHINFTNFLSILPWIGQASKYFLCNNNQDSLSASIMHDNFVIHINVAVCKNINYQEDIMSDFVSDFVHINYCCGVWIAIMLGSFLCLSVFKDHMIWPRNWITKWPCWFSDIPLLSVVSGKGYLSF